MRTIHEIRHANLLELIARAGSTQAFADSIGRSHSQVSQLKNRTKHSRTGQRREVGDEFARHVERELKLELGWMDTAHPSIAHSRPIPPAPAAPAGDFADRRLVSESDWQLLQDISHMPLSEQEALRHRVHEEAAKYKVFALEVLERFSDKGKQ